ncbi:MAG: DUF4118 domain-containing protein [Alphaproteobacteria bacterium]|nr:DUF4118 domain-containing protein [Alphaproteobacteria bacterium]
MADRPQRLGELDLVERYRAFAPPLAIQAAFGVACAAAALGARVFVDVFAPTAGPYSLIYPAILIATLFGRWPAGLIAAALSFIYAWYFVLPPAHSFAFEDPGDGPRTLVNGAVALAVVWLADIFRSAVRRAVAERDREIAARDMLMQEINHRMKNNFAIVASLLNLQSRQETSEEVKAALAVAASRVQSFAAAHESLYSDARDVQSLDIRDYLQTLAPQLSDALIRNDRVKLSVDADSMTMARDKAVALGLVVNEAVTNAAKHAFSDRGGEIAVAFKREGEGWRLTITDNGRGMAADPQRTGLGSRLISAFAQNAGAELNMERLAQGTRVVLSTRA